jgi:ribose 5-phosphate isomerase B
MRISLGSDHAGYPLKERLKRMLSESGIEPVDHGAYSTESVDYPDFVLGVTSDVLSGSCATGILCCGTGIGMSIAANKIRGIRAALAWTPELARLGREHNNSNVLCLGGRYLDFTVAEAIVKAWIAASFVGDRHQRRVEKILALERQQLKS